MPREGFPRKRLDSHSHRNCLSGVTNHARPIDCILRYNVGHEYILEFVSNTARIGYQSEGPDVCENFAARNHVFLVALATVRVGLSRAINGSAAFFPTLGGGVVLVLIHRLFAFLAFYSHGFGILVKGRPDIIVRNGQCDLATMQRNHVFNACSGRRHAS